MAATPLLKCPTCDGQRRVIHIAECKADSRGWRQEAVTCPDCHGTGVAKKPVGRVRRLLAKMGVA